MLSLPPTPRTSATAPRPSGLLSDPQSCPTSAAVSPSPSADLVLHSDDPDPTIVEALNGSKDRLFVLKLGDDFDNLLSERGNTPGKRCSYTIPSSYQRMLVHRCAQYYKLAIEVDNKTISISVGPDSRVPKARIAEIVPVEQTPAPAFKIMRRNADERARAKQPPGDSTEDDHPDGTALSEEPKRRTQMTIEERTAAYDKARSRIFEGFQEKEAQPSPPPTRRDSGNSEPRWVDKRRSDYSRGSPGPQDNMSIPASYYPPMLFNPNAPSAPHPQHPQYPQQYDPAGQPMPYMYPQAYYPAYGYYPQPQFDPRQPVPMQMAYAPPPGAPYPYPPQHSATWPPPQASPETQRHAFPQMPNRPMLMPNDPFPQQQYMQPYQYGGYMQQPVLVPTPPDGPGSNHSSRSGSRNGHASHGSSGSNGAKGPRGAVGPWGTSTVATPMRSVTGMNRRLSTSSSSTSAYSSSGGGGAGSGSRTPADETASIASSASSSSSRRTYTSTSTTSKHPLPPRPDWAVGLLPEPPLSRTTSASSNDSRLRLTSRSSSGNQIPRTGVKLGSDFPPLSEKGNFTPPNENASFPPLNGNGNGSGAARVGVWREGSPAQLFSNSTEENDPFKRPPPKSWALYNPNTGTGPATLQDARPALSREGTGLTTSREDVLVEQVAKLSIEGGKAGGTS